MSLLSCDNCWHNPLQYDLLGDEVGYCVRHRVVLRKPEATTCGRLLRKDLGLARANAVQQRHAEQFPRGEVSTLQREAKRHLPIWTSHDTSALQADDIRAAVVDYGERDTKIESLAQLNALAKPTGPDSVRAEIAVLSLGRGYVRTCVQRDGHWTSGLHLAWWLGRRLAEPPRIDLRDLAGYEAQVLAHHLVDDGPPGLHLQAVGFLGLHVYQRVPAVHEVPQLS